MNKLLSTMNLIANNDSAMPVWVVKSFPIIKIVLAVLICLLSIFIIIAVLSQKTESNGSNVLTGQADTFYNRNKGQSLQGKIKKLTVIASILIFVLCVAFLIINSIYSAY